jgi:type III restriction enzyme
VKSRLAVLEPAAEGNYYEAFSIVPSAMLDKLRQGKVLVRNWHALAWDSEEQIKKRRSVDKRGVKSDEAYTREVLGEMAERPEPAGDQRRGAPRLAGQLGGGRQVPAQPGS